MYIYIYNMRFSFINTNFSGGWRWVPPIYSFLDRQKYKERIINELTRQMTQRIWDNYFQQITDLQPQKSY